MNSRRTVVAALLAFGLSFALTVPSVAQIPPPSAINYQGVLRDATGAPLSGSYDMSFRIYDAPTGGNEYLIDLHTTATGSPVTVAYGLFNVEVGSGTVIDGSGPGTYLNIIPVFRSTTDLYLEVLVGSEVLSPRIHFASAPSAFNTAALNGYPSTSFPLKASSETITGDWTNTANPWADNEVSDALTIGPSSTITLGTTPSISSGRLFYETANDALAVGDGTSTDYYYPGMHAGATSEGGAALTALAFASDPTACGAGFVVRDIAANGTLTCVADDDQPDSDAEVPDALTINGGAIGNSTLVLEQGVAPANIAEGRIQWDTDNDALVVGNGASTTTFRSATDSDSRYLRKDVADNAAGDITFSSGHIGVGVAPTALVGINQNFALSTLADGMGIRAYIDNSWSSSPSTTSYGGWFRSNASGPTSDITVVGLSAQGTGGAATTGTRYGVFGAATGGNGFHIGVYGAANQPGVSGTHYGVYGSASGGATNWGLYTPGNAYVEGTLDLGTGGNDDLTAADVSDLTDGGATTLHTHAAGDAATLDGLDSTAFLRSDVADTATGVITFSAASTDIRGQLVDGDSSYLTVGENLSVSGMNLGVGIAPSVNMGIRQQMSASSAGDLYGVYSSMDSTDATLASWVMGGRFTATASGVGNAKTTYGIYASASGGATNWGLYTPDNLQFGDATTDSHIFWGTLKSGSMSDSHIIIPFTPNYGYVGTPTNYWYRMYANAYYGKSTTITAFDIYRDLDLLDAMTMENYTDPKTGRTSLIFSPETLPPMIKGDPAVDGEGADQFVNFSKAIGFCFGSFRQMRTEVRNGLTSVQRQIDERTADPTTGNQSLPGSLSIQLDKDNNDRARFSVFKDGGTTVAQELMRLDEEGNLHLKGALRPSALDLAEYHPLSAPASAGDVLVADRARTGFLRPCELASDKAVVGIVSSEPGVVLGSGLQRIASADIEMASALDSARRRGDATEEARLWTELERRFASGHAAIALSGTVPCKVDAAYGAIEVGDLLVASPTPGHAMRAEDPRAGTVVAKALEPLASGTGLIKVLVMLR